MNTSRRIRANRRRWSQPSPIIRFSGPLSVEHAEAIKRRWLEDTRRRQPIFVTDDWEVIR